MNQTKDRADPYQLVTNLIIEQLERGVVAWHCPWQRSVGSPRNFHTGKHYRGANIFLLGMHHYASPYWMTFCQVKEREGKIRKGERSAMVVKFGEYGKADPDGMDSSEKKKGRIFLRTYSVFNAVQIEGIYFPVHTPLTPSAASRDARADEIVQNMPQRPTISEGRFVEASYNKVTDTVEMPHFANFDSVPAYHKTLFHELIHSTGHAKRLNRPSLVDHDEFGGKIYSREELVAEMGAAFLAVEAGIAVDEHKQTAAYLNGWLNALRDTDHRRWIVQAANQAGHAADFILRRAVVAEAN